MPKNTLTIISIMKLVTYLIFFILMPFSVCSQATKPIYSYSSLSREKRLEIEKLDIIIGSEGTSQQKLVETELVPLLADVLRSNSISHRDYFFKKLQRIPTATYSTVTRKAVAEVVSKKSDHYSFFYLILCGKLGVDLNLDEETFLISSGISNYRSVRWAGLLYLAKMGNVRAENIVLKKFSSEEDLAVKFRVLSYHVAFIGTDNALNILLELANEKSVIVQTGDEIPIVYEELDPVEVYLPIVFSDILVGFSRHKALNRAKIKAYLSDNEFKLRAEVFIK